MSSWDEYLTLPLRISDLPRNALLAITVWDLNTPDQDIPVAGSTISLFDRYGELRQGPYEIRMWPNKVADCYAQTTTPGIVSDYAENEGEAATTTNNDSFPILDELDRLAKVKAALLRNADVFNIFSFTIKMSKLYNNGHIIRHDWLDKLTIKEMQMAIQQEKQNSNYYYLSIEFPDIKSEDVKYHVVYFEEVFPLLFDLLFTTMI